MSDGGGGGDQVELEDQQAERAVLGSVLGDVDVLWKLAPLLQQKDFASNANAFIFEAMLALHTKRRPVDHLTLAEELKTRGQLASVGGPAYLMSLDQVVPVAANALQYAEVVKDRARRRRGVAVMKRAIQRLGDLSVDPVQLAARAAAELVKIGAGAVRFRTLREVNQAVFDEVVERHDSGREPIILTGLRTWDNAIGGVQPTVIIIGGKPGNGKSALVAALCKGMAVNGTMIYGRYALGDEEVGGEILASYGPDDAFALPINIIFVDHTGKAARVVFGEDGTSEEIQVFAE